MAHSRTHFDSLPQKLSLTINVVEDEDLEFVFIVSTRIWSLVPWVISSAVTSSASDVIGRTRISSLPDVELVTVLRFAPSFPTALQ